jgi:hypothetical protein
MIILDGLNIFLVFPSLLSVLLAYFTLKQHRKRSKYCKIPGPPTKGLVIVKLMKKKTFDDKKYLNNNLFILF